MYMYLFCRFKGHVWAEITVYILFLFQTLTVGMKWRLTLSVRMKAVPNSLNQQSTLRSMSLSDHTKLSVLEKAKSLYSGRLQNLYPSRNINLTGNGENSHQTRVLGMGWALKESKVRVAFSDRQKTYMLEKYNQGKNTGQRLTHI